MTVRVLVDLTTYQALQYHSDSVDTFTGGALAPSKGFKWYELITADVPDHNPTTQIVIGPTYAVNNTNGTATQLWSVENKAEDELRAAMQAGRVSLYEAKVAAGYETDGLHVQIDDGSRANLSALALTGLLALTTGSNVSWPDDYATGWVSVEGTRIPLPTPADGIALANACGVYYAGLVQKSQDLQDAINGAADQAALLAIDITAGW